ncbi:MAG: hypothetical protein ACJAY5_000575 [Actinomycetes bacterium]|jgi:hypothetical protein
MSTPSGPGDPTEPHGRPPVTPRAADVPVDPPTREHPAVVDPTEVMPAAGAVPPATGGVPPGGLPPSRTPMSPSSGNGGPRPITWWVIGVLVLVALLGLVGGALWAAGTTDSPEPAAVFTPSATSSSPTPTYSRPLP